MSSQLTRSQVAAMIDHTLLKPEAIEADVKELVKEAAKLGTYSICISPSLLPVEVPENVHVATVVGFPQVQSSRKLRLMRRRVQFTMALKK